ncbi:MAG: CysS/YqeB C-terminal domain-containing protein, partial [Ilumatobacteraceae bacterium]
AMLPDRAWVLGIDEHTGLVIDIDAGSAEVTGNGGVTLRVDGQSRHHPSGTVMDLAMLTDRDAVARAIGGTSASSPQSADPDPSPEVASPATAEVVATSLAEEADRADAAFTAALTAGDAATATGVMLSLEQAIWAWSADTLQSDETDRARQVLRSMVTRLGDAAVGGLADPRSVVGPLVETLLELRASARTERRFETSDLIRDRLDANGVEVRDTADGAEWDLRA